MGDLARSRARSWLAATSFVLLLVSVLIAWAIIWLLIGSRETVIATIYNEMEVAIYWFDLVTSTLVAGANVLLGQAIVSYEIFTGKTLPRRGFERQWRSALVLALVYSAVVGASLPASRTPSRAERLAAHHGADVHLLRALRGAPTPSASATLTTCVPSSRASACTRSYWRAGPRLCLDVDAASRRSTRCAATCSA